MKKIAAVVLVLFTKVVCLPLQAQNMASVEANFLGVSLVYGFDNHPVLYTQCKAGVNFEFGGFTDFSASYFLGAGLIKWLQVSYCLSVEQRYYYNLIKRQSKGKKTLHKSADYLSIKPSFCLQKYKDGLDQRNTNYLSYCSVNWGMRRAIGNRFYFDGSIGVGPSYSTNDRTWSATYNVALCFGFQLFK